MRNMYPENVIVIFNYCESSAFTLNSLVNYLFQDYGVFRILNMLQSMLSNASVFAIELAKLATFEGGLWLLDSRRVTQKKKKEM